MKSIFPILPLAFFHIFKLIVYSTSITISKPRVFPSKIFADIIGNIFHFISIYKPSDFPTPLRQCFQHIVKRRAHACCRLPQVFHMGARPLVPPLPLSAPAVQGWRRSFRSSRPAAPRWRCVPVRRPPGVPPPTCSLTAPAAPRASRCPQEPASVCLCLVLLSLILSHQRREDRPPKTPAAPKSSLSLQ